jgi:hypothetical protein
MTFPRLFTSLLFICLSTAFPLMSRGQDLTAETIPPAISTMEHLAPQIRLLVGAPREGEKAKEGYVERLGFLFHPESYVPEPDAAKQIVAKLRTETKWTFLRAASEGSGAFCGPFKPDYVLEVGRAEDRQPVTVALCYTCQEARVYWGKSTQAATFDASTTNGLTDLLIAASDGLIPDGVELQRELAAKKAGAANP